MSKITLTLPHKQAKKRAHASRLHREPTTFFDSEMTGIPPKVKVVLLEMIDYIKDLETRLEKLEGKD